MHYAGMAAMRPEALLEYDAGLVAISIVVAVAWPSCRSASATNYIVRKHLQRRLRHRPTNSAVMHNAVDLAIW
jgi:NO-binding membrane sensor protein with MHYT domain